MLHGKAPDGDKQVGCPASRPHLTRQNGHLSMRHSPHTAAKCKNGGPDSDPLDCEFSHFLCGEEEDLPP